MTRGLCTNCLTYSDVYGVEVGNDKGSQRDPYREKLTLCNDCSVALTGGRLDVFHERYSDERTVKREHVAPTEEP